MDHGKYIIPIQARSEPQKIPKKLADLQFVNMSSGEIEVDPLADLFASLIQKVTEHKLQTDSPQSTYDLTDDAMEWARTLQSWWESKQIDQSFELLDATAGNAPRREYLFGLGANLHPNEQSHTPPYGVLSDLHAAGLLRLEDVGRGKLRITLTKALQDAVASNFAINR
jgi:hypothetical protein